VTGTLPTRPVEPTVVTPAAPSAPIVRSTLPRRAAGAVRPWSALVCGMPEDRTLLIVDWLLLACRAAGMVAQAVPLADGDASPHGMYVEVAADASVEHELGELPWGAVDLVVAGEHLELVRAIEAGFVDRDVTTVVASCRRSFTNVEREVAPQHVLGEREIDALAAEAAHAYHAFDGHEVARWYHLPTSAQPGLLLGAVCGTGITGLDDTVFVDAIRALGIDAELFADAFRRGTRLGRRQGGRVRRVKTAYQFTRKRRAVIDHHSRRDFEAHVERAAELVQPEHLGALQEAIFRLCEFQDADWAAVLVDHVADVASAEREARGGQDPAAHESIMPDVIRALATMLVWPDAAWIANRKRRQGRLKDIRTAHGITRRDAYDLVDHIPLDALERSDARHPKLRVGAPSASTPPLLQPLRVEPVRSTTLAGAMRLRRLAATARHRSGSARQRHELDTAETWLQALHDALRTDHALARIVARSGTLVQGAGAVREANRATAHAFWGRVVRPSLAIDRAAGPDPTGSVAAQVIPFCWEQLCRSGPLALWEYAAQVLGIALAQSRGLGHAECVQLADVLCEARRPGEGR
jgi:indolepyruvate ferredoxin oxidoreductase beta subunit